MLKMKILHLVSMCSQVFPIAATSFDLLSTFFITLTVTSPVINRSIYVYSFLMLWNIFLQSMEDVNNRWCTISLGIGLAGTPCKVQNWAKEELRDLKPSKWWGFVEGWDLCTADSTPTFPCTAGACPPLQLHSLALFSSLERRLVSGAGKCCQRRRFSILDPRFLTLDHFPTSWSRLRLELGPEVSSRLHFRPFYSGRDTWL